jgi:hypothetical protein
MEGRQLISVADAFGIEARMPAGLARMVYRPDEQHGLIRTVESKTKEAGIVSRGLIICRNKRRNY